MFLLFEDGRGGEKQEGSDYDEHMNAPEDILRTHHEDSANPEEDKESNLDDSTGELKC